MEDQGKIEKLLAFLRDSPDDPFLKHALALEYIKTGADGAAKQLFLDILTRDPGYIGSYYHLAGLLEKMGDTAAAMAWYEKGMAAAREIGDRHAYNELCSAYDNLID